MDGILGDFFLDGRRMRPATLEYALANYPRVIVGIKLNQFHINAPHACDANDVITVRGKWALAPRPGFCGVNVAPFRPFYTTAFAGPYHFAMTRGDYDKCLAIAKLMTIPLFPSDVEQDWFDKAAAHIRQFF
jgi:hypothetical protein